MRPYKDVTISIPSDVMALSRDSIQLESKEVEGVQTDDESLVQSLEQKSRRRC